MFPLYLQYNYIDVLCVLCLQRMKILDTSMSVFVDDCVALKENLSDEIEYTLLPKPAWDKLVSWYGLQPGQVCITKE